MKINKKYQKITRKELNNVHKQNVVFVKYVYVPLTVLASQTHLAEALTLKLR
jgi:hypothetical protein